MAISDRNQRYFSNYRCEICKAIAQISIELLKHSFFLLFTLKLGIFL